MGFATGCCKTWYERQGRGGADSLLFGSVRSDGCRTTGSSGRRCTPPLMYANRDCVDALGLTIPPSLLQHAGQIID